MIQSTVIQNTSKFIKNHSKCMCLIMNPQNLSRLFILFSGKKKQDSYVGNWLFVCFWLYNSLHSFFYLLCVYVCACVRAVCQSEICEENSTEETRKKTVSIVFFFVSVLCEWTICSVGCSFFSSIIALSSSIVVAGCSGS